MNFGAHHAVRFGVPAPLEIADLPELAHLGAHPRNDVLEVRLFARLRLFLGEC